jgi:ribosomal protein S18 acetylase RimI-like enzyme
MDLSIRPAELNDAAFMAPLVNDADGGMPLAIWTSLAAPGADPWDVGVRRIQSDDTPVSWCMGWIAEDAGTPVGVLIVHQLSETPEQLEATIMSPLWVPVVELELLASDSGYIKTLSVIEALRDQGVGTQLLEFAERFRGPEGMSVIVGDHDGASRRFFERHGFSEAARRLMVKDGWQTPGTEWILLKKP